ncbi:hypothetical protein F5B20DRAFT_23838 [Whalleya microplaca]|nr:hypothetical protein F5B20DRAFT_23838 [Whalleya microplaca]
MFNDEYRLLLLLLLFTGTNAFSRAYHFPLMELPRLAPCRILLQHSIPTSLWFEDAIGRYGVPTVVFDLHLLVPDIEQASAILRQQGWSPQPPSVYFFLHSTSSIPFQRLM